ncbi:MAG: hypothetical protein AAF557_04890 [Pseudomonadota bacterium]
MFTNTQHCDVGYCLKDPSGGFAFQPPRTVFSQRDRPLNIRAIQNCPAVNAMERQLIEMPAPIGIRMTVAVENNQPVLNVNPQGTFAQPDVLGKMLRMEAPDRWRHPKKPLIEIDLPIFLVTDEPCILAQLPPFLMPAMRRWPGSMVASRFPVTWWPQDLKWSFEWEDIGQELSIRQGEPLCYFMCEFNHPEKRPRLVEAALTDELDEFRRGMDSIHHLTLEIGDVMDKAKDRRPERLLVPLEEAEASA